MKYSFSLYLHGPYSPSLADDYYHLDNVTPAPLPEGFRREDFLALVKGRDEKWLEAAATILAVYEYNRNISRERLIDIVTEIKSSFSRENIEKTLEDLKSAKLLDI